jgi:hypothetical protein
MRPLVLAAVAAALPLAAAAQPKQPSRDYAATYRIEAEGRASEMRVFYSAATRRQRVEMADAGMAMINDQASGRVLILNEPARVVMEMPAAAARQQPLLSLPDDMTLSRTGTATVAGHRCTTYRAVQAGADRGTVCVSDYGILLSGDFRQGDRTGRMEATSVTLAPQPAALFQPPQGWQTMQMPSGPPGAKAGPATRGGRPQR